MEIFSKNELAWETFISDSRELSFNHYSMFLLGGVSDKTYFKMPCFCLSVLTSELRGVHLYKVRRLFAFFIIYHFGSLLFYFFITPSVIFVVFHSGPRHHITMNAWLVLSVDSMPQTLNKTIPKLYDCQILSYKIWESNNFMII